MSIEFQQLRCSKHHHIRKAFSENAIPTKRREPHEIQVKTDRVIKVQKKEVNQKTVAE